MIVPFPNKIQNNVFQGIVLRPHSRKNWLGFGYYNNHKYYPWKCACMQWFRKIPDIEQHYFGGIPIRFQYTNIPVLSSPINVITWSGVQLLQPFLCREVMIDVSLTRLICPHWMRHIWCSFCINHKTIKLPFCMHWIL